MQYCRFIFYFCFILLSKLHAIKIKIKIKIKKENVCLQNEGLKKHFYISMSKKLFVIMPPV